MFATFNRNNQRNASPFFSINDTEQFVPLEEDNARLFAVLGYPSQISLAKKYEEHDSHPQKIGPGFSKEIVPLDREIFTLDDSPRLRAIKQDSRPICASCDRDLLICQDSTSNGRIGRRPWILNCGHVVDSECLELARTRARVAKKNGRGKARRGSVAAGRRGAKLVESPDALTTPLTSASDSKKRKTGRCQQQKSSSQSQSHSRDLSTISDCAHRRQERARAREAKKMNEKTPESTTHISTKKTTPERSEAKLDCPGEEDEEEISFVEAQNLKGKGKAQDDLMNEKMIILSPVTDKSIALTAITPKPSLRFTWTICPIVGCKGPGGDLLAAVGSKKAPWEMFV
ncbi:hypothetical protein BY996DRAFT_4588040 [Phakopsora pachyrhizi]|nr:hypothetical protein BY996DRAFT_4588040 [Phakopsora pachyrhizi]